MNSETDMERNGDTEKEGMDLHSEKVRRLLGEIPPGLVLWGIAVITIVFIALIAAVCLLPYPYSDGESILFHLLGIQLSQA